MKVAEATRSRYSARRGAGRRGTALRVATETTEATTHYSTTVKFYISYFF